MYLELAEAALTVYEKRETIGGIFAKAAFLLEHGLQRVVVFGPGGTGKSTLGRALSDEEVEETQQYVESPRIDKEHLNGIPLGRVKVAPGQERRRRVYWPELIRDLSSGTFDGVIVVNAWGYHSFALESFKSHPLYEPGMSSSDFMHKYLDAARAEEIAVLRELQPHLITAGAKRLWMLTLVTKQDLWWDRRAAVKSHYETGEYSKVIEDIRSRRGDHGFDHAYMSTSLDLLNFATPADGALATTVAGYDRRLQQAHLHALIQRVQELCGRGGGA